MHSSTSLRALSIAILLALCTVAGRAQVAINEFAYDDTQVDDEEFVELFNSSDADVDLGGWSLATGSDLGPGPQHSLPGGTTIPAGGYLVAGSAAVPEVDVVLSAAELFGNGPAYIFLIDRDLEIVDAVVYEVNKGLGGFPAEALDAGGIWGNHMLVASTHMSWQRWFDGVDTGSNDSDFGHLPWTPGASNDRAQAPSFSSDFQEGGPEEDNAALPGSFVPGRIVDPMTVSASNFNAIPESPDGGLAMVAWDPAGGGNFVALEARPVSDMMFEAWVYFDAVLEAGDENETWSIGLRGTSGTFYNTPILFDANGNTGVTWTYQVTSFAATLYLVDEGYGGSAGDRVRLAEIPILEGENDGWQRLRLEVEGDRVVGYFGGTWGSTDDGEQVEGTLRGVGLGNFYIGYREALSDNSLARPLTLDLLEVRSFEETAPLFARGNVNADGTTDLTDAVFILNFLFLGGPPPSCLDAADANDSDVIDLTDGVYVLNFLFLGGPPPPAPFPGCGVATGVSLGCVSFPSCP